MSDTPFFSVVIPTYNRKKLVEGAVHSALSQDFDSFEVIVVDDGSTDGTEELFESLYTKVQYIKKTNGGVSSARNLGIEKSSGEYIVYLDSDDIWESNKLSMFASAIEMTQADFIFSDFSRYNLTKQEQVSESNSRLYPAIYDLGELAENDTYSFNAPAIQKLVISGYPFYPSAFAIRRRLHIDYRWDPEVLKSEDFNLVIRLINRHQFAYIDKVLTTIQMHDTNKSYDMNTKGLVHLNTLKTYANMYAKNDLALKIVKRQIGIIELVHVKKSLKQRDLLSTIKYAASAAVNSGNHMRLIGKLKKILRLN